MTRFKPRTTGFTIVELLIVIVVIGILAAITVVAYTGITQQANETTLKSDLTSAAKQLHLARVGTDAFPTNADSLKKSNGTTFAYTHDNNAGTFCLSATSPQVQGKTFYITQGSTVNEGECPPPSAIVMQTITTTNCPTERTRAVDARDNHTYWVQKLADGKCWMLTNLGYAGGGTNTYGDVKTLTNRTGSSGSVFLPYYYVPSSTINHTADPANPSTSTDGTGQYGYFYNWCAAMGAENGTNGQQNTAACAAATTPAPDTSVSVCPAGWRLPVGNGGEFAALNTAINGGLTYTDAGLRTSWLGQIGGYEGAGFFEQGNYGYYWSSSQGTATTSYNLVFGSSTVVTASYIGKGRGLAVRCLAN